MIDSAISKRSALSLASSLLLSGAMLAGCGGGSGDPGTGSTLTGGSTGSTGSTNAAIVLDNLPQKQTTSVSASIGYEVTAASGNATVYCRLDNYAPIVCPSTFDLGQSTPLAAGDHVVDYYVDTGSGIDLSAPAASYTWTIAAATSTTSTTAGSTSSSTPSATPSATSLNALANRSWEGNGTSTSSFTPSQVVTNSSGKVLAKTNADSTIELRTNSGDQLSWSGNRSEFDWFGQNLAKGTDYWYAFAVKPLEYDSTGRQIFFQLQMANSIGGCGGPTLEFQQTGGVVVVNKNVGTSTLSCSTVASNLGPVVVGAWSKWVIHFRPGYQASQNPILEVWRDGVKVLTHTEINSSPNSGEYAKIGVYKWDGAWGSVSSRANQYSPLYFGQGVDLKANADASIAAY